MSVFTYDPDPPRVSSPWLQPATGSTPPPPDRSLTPTANGGPDGPAKSALLSDYGVTKLVAEPQDGPTEYKLHLLLRQRRTYRFMSTTNRIAGSQQSRPIPSEPKMLAAATAKQRATVAMASSSQTRQSRLLQLTTQLFWRLRQSSPYHASVANQELVIPHLADDSAASSVSIKPGNPLPGLEESRGALYEIGVADDGTLVGLTKDEMDESIANLRIMAASLGCQIQILRRVIVGTAEWEDENCPSAVRRGELWVAEVLVMPNLGSGSEQGLGGNGVPSSIGLGGAAAVRPAGTDPNPSVGPSTMNQLRVTLTGPTTSGKSTLLGTLSTGTLDNGHGKSRLSLLKHRHELASGVTSSVAQELIGYKQNEIVNYSNRNIESWIGIHDFTDNGRLVFVSDSAGHTRYRRTILRGIIGWSPHWTVLCIAADDEEDPGNDITGRGTGSPGCSSPRDLLGITGAGVDLAKAHLELCLRLGIPLAIVITKIDKGTKSGMQKLLGKALSIIKKAGRTPRMLQPGRRRESELTEIPQEDADAVRRVVDDMAAIGDPLSLVPIVMTSAVRGQGIGLVHALLNYLPLPAPPTSHDLTGPVLNPEQPVSLFHIEDKFSLPASHVPIGGGGEEQADFGTVVAGYLRFGKLCVGDKVVVGPFPSEEDDGSHGHSQNGGSRGLTPPEGRQSPAGIYSGLSISHPSATELNRIASRNAVSASAIKGEWHNARIVSIRNLRLPVLTLGAGQVGSVGLVIDLPDTRETGEEVKKEGVHEKNHEKAASVSTPPLKIRKGMVLAIPSVHMVDTGLSLQAASGLTASFADREASSLMVGSLVNIYVASVRAAARILRVSSPGRRGRRVMPVPSEEEDDDDVFGFGDDDEDGSRSTDAEEAAEQDGSVEVKLELLTSREWIELGSRILVLEGGRQEKSGLEGLVGKVIEVVD